MNLVLKNNVTVFEFNEQFYLQTQGTAMGTKMAPAYANLFIGKLEEHLVHRSCPVVISSMYGCVFVPDFPVVLICFVAEAKVAIGTSRPAKHSTFELPTLIPY